MTWTPQIAGGIFTSEKDLPESTWNEMLSEMM